MPSTDIKLLDEEGREVGIGEAGEICAKGPQVMSGYWQKPEAKPRPSPTTATSGPAMSASSTPRAS